MTGDAFFAVGITLYGKFKIGIGVEAGEGKWVLFVFPIGLVDGEVDCLAGYEGEALGFFSPVTVDVVGNGGYGNDFTVCGMMNTFIDNLFLGNFVCGDGGFRLVALHWRADSPGFR